MKIKLILEKSDMTIECSSFEVADGLYKIKDPVSGDFKSDGCKEIYIPIGSVRLFFTY